MPLPPSRVCVQQASEWGAGVASSRRSTTSQARGRRIVRLGFSPIPCRKFVDRRRASLENRRCHRPGDRLDAKKGVTDVISGEFRISKALTFYVTFYEKAKLVKMYFFSSSFFSYSVS